MGMIIINFKNYLYGHKSLNLVKKIERYLPKAIVCVSATDVRYIKNHTKLGVFGQHFDVVSSERSTGYITVKSLKSSGVSGTLLNHSEHRISEGEIKEGLRIAKKKRLKVILCVENLEEARKYKNLRLWAMAYEDKKLVGSGKSIVEYRQNEICRFVKILKRSGIIPICGAGISSAKDIRVAEDLGCKGVLIASALANNKKPEGLLKELK